MSKIYTHFKDFRVKFNKTTSLLEEREVLKQYQPKTILEVPIFRNQENQDLKYYIEMATKHHMQTNVNVVNCLDSEWMHRDWINIACFLKNISGAKRGEQHKACKDIIIHLKDRWENTIQYNTNQNVFKLIKLFNLLGLSHSLSFSRDNRNNKFYIAHCGAILNNLNLTQSLLVKYSTEETNGIVIHWHLNKILRRNVPKAQMFSTFTHLMGSQGREDVKLITDNLTRATMRIDQITSMYTEFIVSIKDYLSSFIKIGSVVLLLSKICSLTYLLMVVKFTKVQLVALLTLILPTEVGGVLNTLCDALIRAVKTIKDQFSKPIGHMNDHSFIGAFFNMIKLMFVHSCAPIDKNTFDQINYDTNKIKSLGEFLRSCSNIWSVMFRVLTYFCDVARDAFMKSCGYIPSIFNNGMEEDEVQKFITQYDNAFNKEFDTCATSTTSAQRVIELLHTARTLEHAIYYDSLSVTGAFTKMRVLPLLRCAVIHLQKIVGDIPPHVRNGFEGFRRKPWWLFMFGASNIGKSSVLQPIIANMLAAKLKLVETFDDPHNYSYYRVCGAKFYARYHNQPIIQYNDLFQNKGDDDAMNEAIMELTNIVDESPYELNMPDVESKGKVFCTSTIVISNSQQDIIGLPFITNRCLSGGEHLYRRRNLVIQPKLNKKYLDKSGSGIAPDYNGLQFTPSKYADFIPCDLYTIEFYNPLNGKLIDSMVLDKGLSFIMHNAVAHLTSQTTLHKKLQDSLKTTFDAIATAQMYNPITTTQAVNFDSFIKVIDFYCDKLKLLGPRMVSNDTFYSLRNTIHTIGRTYKTTNRDFMNQMDTELYSYWKEIYEAPDVLIDDVPMRMRWDCIVDGFENLRQIIIKGKGNVYVIDPRPYNTTQLQNTASSIKDNIQGAIQTTNNWFYTSIKSVKDYFSKPPLTTTIDECLEFHDAIDTTNTCNCIYMWQQTLKRHPVTINDTELQTLILNILTVKHNEYCGKIFDNEQDVLNNILIEVLMHTVQERKTSTTYKLEKFFNTTFPNFMKDSWYATSTNAKSFVSNHPWLTTLGIVGSVGLGLALVGGTLATSSSDNQYERQIKLDDDEAEAQTDEGNRRAKKLLFKRVRNIQDKADAHYDSTNRRIEEVLRHNIVTFRIMTIKDDSVIPEDIYMNGLAIFGTVFIMPRHFWHFVENYSSKFMIAVTWSNGSSVNIPYENIQVFKPDHVHLKDIIFINIPKLCSKRDIRHFFVSEKDELENHEAYLYGKSLSDYILMTVDSISLVSLTYKVEDMQTKASGLISGQHIETPVVYKYYNAKTQKGDCGALLMFVNPKLNSRIVAGMHVAGIVGNSIGYSVPLFVEDLDDAYEYFKNSGSYQIMGEPLAFAHIGKTDTQMCIDLKNIGANVIGRTGMINNKYVNLTISRKTKIRPSLVQDFLIEKIGPNSCAPARLRPFINNQGEKIYPFMKAYVKLNKMCPNMVRSNIYNDILEHCYLTIESWKSIYTTDYSLRRVLNDDETTNGIVGMKQIDFSTSPGFPYIMYNSNNGKNPWFEKTKVEENGFVRRQPIGLLKQEILDREEKAKKGIKKETYFCDTLKDETRLLQKVESGKTRLFQVAPMDLNYLIRKYFGAFLAHLSVTFIDGEVAIGVNCLSNEWHYMFEKFVKTNNYDSDAESYDASTSHQFGCFFADLANKFYNDDNINKLIRIVLMCTVFETLHIVGDAVVESLQGNMSGIVATAHVNSAVNMFLIRLAYVLRKDFDTLANYHKEVLNKFYGDDVKGNTDLSDFNNDLLKEKLALVGYVITAANHLESNDVVTFLKRTNYYNEEVKYNVGLLDKKVIEEIPRWCESDPSIMRDQLQRFNASLMEAALYGKQYHQKLYEIYFESCLLLRQHHYNIDLDQLLRYKDALKTMFPERF